MYTAYPYTYTSDGEGPWWGIRCPERVYERMVRQMGGTRCFAYLTNNRGETLAIAVEGPHLEGDTNVFVPLWAFRRLGISDGDEVTFDPILEELPKGTTVLIRPLTGVTVEGPMFLEGLTEALNQLGVVQEGLLSAIVDPSMPDLHEFMIENLSPAKVCLADGELRVELERALDRPPTPERPSTPEQDVPCECDFNSILPPSTIKPVAKSGFVAFSGAGHRLDGKPV
jgi:hypothetical protein